ncbi:MAG: hypothetical protein NXI31_07355 [bacterium]|nr:hypothetical protein [bacterium]
MARSPERRRIDFPLVDLAEQLEAFAELWPRAVTDSRARALHAFNGEAVLAPPFLGPRLLAGESITRYQRRVAEQELESAGERHAVVLVRAAGVALGYWDGEALLRHKAIRRYVIRGKGRAQPTHLAKKGKSRYGSRLRLQNWRRQLAETNERLRDWWEEFGEPERIFLSVPVRVFSELAAATPAPPFQKEDPNVQRLPLHVHRPDHSELLRVRRWLGRGHVELPITE